jgi:hypothetical protein
MKAKGKGGRLLFVYVKRRLERETERRLLHRGAYRGSLAQTTTQQQHQQLRYRKKTEQRNQNVLLAAAPESYVHAIDLDMDRQDVMGPKRRSCDGDR